MSRERDEKFFEKSILVLYEDIYRLAYSMTKNEETAKDIAQSTMEKAWRNLDRLKNRKSVKSWVYTIARNETITFFRGLHPSDSFDEPDGSVSYEKFAETEANILDEILKKERSELLIRAIDLLSPKRREIVLLWALGDLQQKEIADILQINYNTVRVALYRGLKELREIYFSLERGDADE